MQSNTLTVHSTTPKGNRSKSQTKKPEQNQQQMIEQNKTHSDQNQSGEKRSIIKLIIKYKPADTPVHIVGTRESEEPPSADLSLKNQAALQGLQPLRHRHRLANQK